MKKNKTTDSSKIDNWLKSVGDLEDHLLKLLDKKKKDALKKTSDIINKPINKKDKDKDKDDDEDHDGKESEKDSNEKEVNGDKNKKNNDISDDET